MAGRRQMTPQDLITENRWEWIAGRFGFFDLEKTEQMAILIGEDVRERYGDELASDWVGMRGEEARRLYDIYIRKGNKKQALRVVRQIAECKEYCVGCQKTAKLNGILMCKTCSFGKANGVCNQPDSCFQIFKNTFRKEVTEKLSEPDATIVFVN